MDRKIKKVPCETCLATGHRKLEPAIEPCKECGGLGWVEKIPNDEKICARCRGNGKVEVIYQAHCEDCGGKGYQVRIVEISTVQQKCGSCEGTGKTDEWHHCDRCDGIGVVGQGSKFLNGQPCPKCHGNGQSHKKVTCVTCDGNRLISVTEERDVTPSQPL